MMLLACTLTAAPQGVSVGSVRPPVGESGEVPVSSPPEQAPSSGSPAEPHAEFVVAPLPLVNPTLDNGLALVVGALYPVSMAPGGPMSATFAMGMATSNDSWASGFGQTLHLARDRFRVVAALAYYDVNFDYFGIGSDAGENGLSIPLNQRGSATVGEFMTHVGGRWYVGGRYRRVSARVHGDFEQTIVPVPVEDADLRTALLGPRVERDTRDNQFYPTHGTVIEILALLADDSLGGRRTYQFYQASGSAYVGIGARQVIAGRVNACAASDRTPFYDLCLIGQFRDLRGYPAGQYRDHALLTGQTEYRLSLPLRLGLVAFGGLGTVAERFGRLSTDPLVPSVGAGVRFMLARQNRLNLRVDYAWGKDSRALHVSVGEAF